MKIHFHTTALSAAFALLLAAPSYAEGTSGSVGSSTSRTQGSDRMGASQQSSATSAMSFQSLDVNRDGKISQSEAAKSQDLQQAWDQADANKDGNIDRSEFSAFETIQDSQSPGMGAPGGTTQPGTSSPSGSRQY